MIKRICLAICMLNYFNCFACTPEIEKDEIRNARLAKIEGDLAYMINLVDTADIPTRKKPWLCEALKDLVTEVSSKYASIFKVTLANLPIALTRSNILGFRNGTKFMLGSVTFEKAEESIENNVDTDIFNPVFIDPKRSHGFIYGLAKSVEFSQVFRNENKYFIKLTLCLTHHAEPQLAVYHGIIDLSKLGEKDEASGNIYMDLSSEGGRRLSLCLDSDVHEKKFSLKQIKTAFSDLFQYKNPSAAAMLSPIIKKKEYLVESIYVSPQLPHGLYSLSCQELAQDEYLLEICNINTTWKRNLELVKTTEGFLISLDSLFMIKFPSEFTSRNSFTDLVFQHNFTEDGTEFRKWQLAAWENIESQNMLFGQIHLRQLANILNSEYTEQTYENVYKQLCSAWNCVKSMQEQKTDSPGVKNSKKTRKKRIPRKTNSAQTSYETTGTTDSSISL